MQYVFIYPGNTFTTTSMERAEKRKSWCENKGWSLKATWSTCGAYYWRYE